MIQNYLKEGIAFEEYGNQLIAQSKKNGSSDNISVVVFAFNTKTAEILNADKIDLSSSNSSIECLPAINESTLKAYVINGECRVYLADETEPYSVEVISLDGRILESYSNIPSANTRLDISHLNGFAIIKVCQGNNSCIIKAIL